LLEQTLQFEIIKPISTNINARKRILSKNNQTKGKLYAKEKWNQIKRLNYTHSNITL